MKQYFPTALEMLFLTIYIFEVAIKEHLVINIPYVSSHELLRKQNLFYKLPEFFDTS